LIAIRPVESSLYRFEKVTFSVRQEAENVFKLTFDNLNHRFIHFNHIAFWAGQEVENEFAVPCNH